jgi:hypothetical protein
LALTLGLGLAPSFFLALLLSFSSLLLLRFSREGWLA